MDKHTAVPPLHVPAIGSIVEMPALHPLSPYQTDTKHWLDGKRGTVIELMESGDRDRPDNPLVCLEIEDRGKPVYGWFLASDIQAGTVYDEFCLSVDCIMTEHRPVRLANGRVKYLFPETDEWFKEKAYEGPTD